MQLDRIFFFQEGWIWIENWRINYNQLMQSSHEYIELPICKKQKEEPVIIILLAKYGSKLLKGLLMISASCIWFLNCARTKWIRQHWWYVVAKTNFKKNMVPSWLLFFFLLGHMLQRKLCHGQCSITELKTSTSNATSELKKRCIIPKLHSRVCNSNK
jgi:hypothetical protein